MSYDAISYIMYSSIMQHIYLISLRSVQLKPICGGYSEAPTAAIATPCSGKNTRGSTNSALDLVEFKTYRRTLHNNTRAQAKIHFFLRIPSAHIFY